MDWNYVSVNAATDLLASRDDPHARVVFFSYTSRPKGDTTRIVARAPLVLDRSRRRGGVIEKQECRFRSGRAGRNQQLLALAEWAAPDRGTGR